MAGMLVFHSKIFAFLICFALLGHPAFAPREAGGGEVFQTGRVNVDGLNLRLDPGLNFPVLKVLKKGATFRVIRQQDEWFQVIEDGDVGWIYGKEGFVTLYAASPVGDGGRTDLEIARERALALERHIQEQRSAIAGFSDKEKEIVSALHQTDLSLHQTRRQAADITAELEIVGAEIVLLEQDINGLAADIQEGRDYAGQRLTALYKLSVLGEMNLLASATSLHDLLKQKAAIRKIIAGDCRVIGTLLDRKRELTALLEALEEQKARQVSLESTYQAAITRLEAEKQKRRQILSEISTQKENRLAVLKYLTDAADRLDHAISALSRGPRFEGKEIKRFAGFKGLLKIPVNGRIVSGYGKYTEPQSGAAHFRKGIVIQSERGSPIRAVFSGRTVFASWLRGYGNVIIIDHGDSFHTVYAHADDLFRAKGDTVETGEVIATVGDSGALGRPALYFEIRHHGNSVDPLHWIDNS
jgi:murein hydrolase activator